MEAGQINKISFIVDADDEKDDAKYKELKRIINDLGFQDIARSYIVCDPVTRTGYLESLILASLPEDKRNCIESFVSCSGMNPKLTHKRIINDLFGIAYSEPPYNFDHSYFDNLKTELTHLFK